MRARVTAATSFTALAPLTAWAHPHEAIATFSSGLAHPLLGIDHLLAMLLVGVIAAMIGGRARWALPLTFVCSMIVGSALALNGLALPFVELAIATSVVVFALVGATGRPVSVVIATALVSAFALFHGHAHGSEMGVSASAASYVAGFALSTAALHATGVLIGVVRSSTSARASLVGHAVRIGSIGAAVCGAYLVTATF